MKYVSINGVITPTDQAVVSVMDHGFLYGMGLFETFRTYNGQPFLLDRHLERLQSGCDSLHIRWQADEKLIRQQIHALMQANDLADAYIRYTLSAGIDILGLPSGAYEQPTIVIYAKALPDAAPRKPSRNDTDEGSFIPAAELERVQQYLSGRSKSLRRLHTIRNTPEGSVRLKSLHYMNSILGKQELQQYGDQPATSVEGLMLTAGGDIAEGIVSNVFFVQGGRLHTPSLETDILPGITRALVMELAEHIGLPVEQGLYSWDRLLTADEIFLTNSIQEIVPVTRLLEEDHFSSVQTEQVGRMTALLYAAYEKEAYRF
ncbi:aminotransferase class IV [Paenibacillus wulumuqiensis]|uniref:aminotransferase class IV n=1 Tax=Paenibacillus wulumuqiensis TaxID=1567107 RepID=UPI00061913DD|nr:aminotransferase class IV [Paenibacillus wulumuqiensis]